MAQDKQIGGDHYKLFHEWMRYEPDGKLYWKKKASSKAMPGYEVGWFDKDGYLCTTLKRKKFRLARVVWMMHYGDIPHGLHIDHINNNRTDNRIENLRAATPAENSCNRKIQANNTSGAKGCTLAKGKYQVQIKKGVGNRYLGRYSTIEEAAEVYRKASGNLHGEFANVG